MASALRNEPPVLRSALIPARKNIIEANETIVTPVQSARTGQRYVLERPIFGEAFSVSRLLEELADDEITAVLRLNTETWVSEDITEQVAREFIYELDDAGKLKLDGDTTADDLSDRFPAYVRNSRSWALWKDDLIAEQPVGRDYDAVRVQHREQMAGAL